MKKFTSTKGFTLIELLVVISIITMMSSIVLAAVNAARARGSVAAGQNFSGYNYRSLGSNATVIWNFIEGAGGLGATIKDESGNGNTGTVAGSVAPTWVAAPVGATLAPSFTNGNIQALNVKGMPGTLNFTMSAWIKPTDVCVSDCYALSMGVLNVNQGVVLSNRSQKLTFSISGQGFFSGSNSSLILNQWQHVAISISGTTAKYYVNGSLKDTVSIPALSSLIFTNWTGNNGKIYVGSWVDNSVPFSGGIDDVAVYNQALTASDVRDVYIAGLEKHVVAEN